MLQRDTQFGREVRQNVSSARPARLGEEPADEPPLKALLAPHPADGMICWPVSARRQCPE
jgi:hypothetical protein